MTDTGAGAWARGLRFSPMSVDAACTIADTWEYPPPYDFYDATADPGDYAEFVTPGLWPERFWQVHQGDELVGFFTAEMVAGGSCEISLGLRPDLTGAGRGLAFLRAGLNLLAVESAPSRVVLDVAAFNERAIKVYQEAGFTIVRTYAQATNGSIFDFVEMELLPG